MRPTRASGQSPAASSSTCTNQAARPMAPQGHTPCGDVHTLVHQRLCPDIITCVSRHNHHPPSLIFPFSFNHLLPVLPPLLTFFFPLFSLLPFLTLLLFRSPSPPIPLYFSPPYSTLCLSRGTLFVNHALCTISNYILHKFCCGCQLLFCSESRHFLPFPEMN